MNKNETTMKLKYPWYDERVIFVGEKKEMPKNLEGVEAMYSTPQKIYEYLDERIWKQEEAKKAASLLMYFTLRNRNKENAMFVGPTGCGKTAIWRCLQELFPERIEIVDGSNLTCDGWKGEKKWATLFASPVFRTNKNTILVIDEADKMLAPKYSYGENVAHSVMSEGLKIMEGIDLEVSEDKNVKYSVDTRNISIVFCGAFSEKAENIARTENQSPIGFGISEESEQEEITTYSRDITYRDIIDFGVMPEFMGRISKVVNLKQMTNDDFFRLVMETEHGPIQKLEKQYQVRIRLNQNSCREMVNKASENCLGVRGVENQLRELMDEAIFEDCERKVFTF